MKYSVIIPCYNEGGNVHALVDLLTRLNGQYEIQWIFVENGSRDNTRAELELACDGKSNFTIAYVDHNQGYGYGIQQGLKKADGDYIGWLHADMQIAPKEIIRFMQIAEMHPAEFLFLKGKRENRSLMDYFFTTCMTLYASAMIGVWMYDIGAIPVLFHRSLLSKMKEIPYDFSIETYVYAKAKKAGFSVYRYRVKQHVRKQGQSSWNRGFGSKIRQSKVIMKDILLIRKELPVR